jgi:DNA-binding NarL/FixJ family response regulator
MKILLADDHQLIFKGIQTLLDGLEEYVLIMQPIQRIKDLMPALHRLQPDLLLLDINLKGDNSLELLPEIKHSFPKIRVFILSTYTQNSVLEKAFDAGAEAFLTKDLTVEELLFAIEKASPQKPFISDGISALNPEKYLKREQEIADPFVLQFDISRREMEIIRFVIAGMTTDAIADVLFLSSHTVHTHRRNILKKLGLHSTTELVKWALNNNIG